MTDEKYTFVTDVAEKKRIARGSFNKRTHNGKGGKVRFPSDYLSNKERNKMNGEISGTVSGSSHPPPIKRLKKIINSIGEQKDQKSLISIIEQIEIYLCKMGSTKDSFNYEKYIPRLFDKINLISNSDIKNSSYVAIFLQLNRVFPDITDYLAQYNKDNLIIEKIHSLTNNNTKMKFYIAYTDSFIKFDNVSPSTHNMLHSIISILYFTILCIKFL